LSLKITTLKNNQYFVKYFENTSWLLFEKILRIIVGIFVSIWVARYLGPEQFGLLSYVQSLVGIFIAFSTLGLDSVVVKELLHSELKRGKILGTAFFLKLLGSVFIIMILLVFMYLEMNDGYTNVLIFIIACSSIFQSFNVIDFYFQSKVISKYTVYSNVITLFVSSAIKIALIYNESPLIYFAFVMLFDSIFHSLGLVYFYYKNKFSILKWEFDFSIAKQLIKNSWPLMISLAIVSIYFKADQVMIKEMISISAVGQYAAAARLSEMWLFIPTTLVMSLFPAIINTRKENKKTYYKLLQRLYNSVIWMAILISIIVSFSNDWIVTILYGKEYYESGSVLMIHIWSSVFIFMGFVFGQYAIIEDLQKKVLYKNVAGMIVNIFLNYVLIGKYGVQGAAMATLIAQFSANYLYDFFDKDLKSQRLMKSRSLFPVYLIKN
jgi:O-antigen/teichoic acid export membrane protein